MITENKLCNDKSKESKLVTLWSYTRTSLSFNENKLRYDISLSIS